jgi:tRNA(Ile)-lysidine synthase
VAIPRKPIQTVRQFARDHALFRPGPLLVAVSGGTDSTALLLVLAELAQDFGLVLHVAHFDHRARPRSAAQDAQYVADLAARCGAVIRIGRAHSKPASEDAARTARYAFLRRVASELGATAIATGHTRDDQAETVLLHAARGSGLAGIAAMRASRDGVVRPLLCLGREDTQAICAGAGIVPREDPTNRSLKFARNRVRHKVLPELAKLNPRAAEALARLATSAAAAVDSLQQTAERALESARDGDHIDLTRLGNDGTLREEALALAWERATGRALAARARAALAAEAARSDGSASLDLPGGRALREYGRLRIVNDRARVQVPAAPRTEVALEPERPVEWSGWTLLLSSKAAPDGMSAQDGWSREAAAPDPPTGLRVRARRPGDRMAGDTRAKLQDVLTDAKIPARDRDEQPLVVTTSGEVWWVPGVTSRTPAGEWRLFAKRSG